MMLRSSTKWDGMWWMIVWDAWEVGLGRWIVAVCIGVHGGFTTRSTKRLSLTLLSPHHMDLERSTLNIGKISFDLAVTGPSRSQPHQIRYRSRGWPCVMCRCYGALNAKKPASWLPKQLRTKTRVCFREMGSLTRKSLILLHSPGASSYL